MKTFSKTTTDTSAKAIGRAILGSVYSYIPSSRYGIVFSLSSFRTTIC